MSNYVFIPVASFRQNNSSKLPKTPYSSKNIPDNPIYTEKLPFERDVQYPNTATATEWRNAIPIIKGADSLYGNIPYGSSYRIPFKREEISANNFNNIPLGTYYKEYGVLTNKTLDPKTKGYILEFTRPPYALEMEIRQGNMLLSTVLSKLKGVQSQSLKITPNSKLSADKKNIVPEKSVAQTGAKVNNPNEAINKLPVGAQYSIKLGPYADAIKIGQQVQGYGRKVGKSPNGETIFQKIDAMKEKQIGAMVEKAAREAAQYGLKVDPSRSAQFQLETLDILRKLKAITTAANKKQRALYANDFNQIRQEIGDFVTKYTNTPASAAVSTKARVWNNIMNAMGLLTLPLIFLSIPPIGEWWYGLWEDPEAQQKALAEAERRQIELIRQALGPQGVPGDPNYVASLLDPVYARMEELMLAMNNRFEEIAALMAQQKLVIEPNPQTNESSSISNGNSANKESIGDSLKKFYENNKALVYTGGALAVAGIAYKVLKKK